jgi:uridine kinase
VTFTASSAVSLLEHLDAAARATLERYLESQSFGPGDVIDAGRDLFFIVEGAVELRRGALELGRLGPGQHFGESALLGDGGRVAGVKALTPLRVARLEAGSFERMRRDDAAVAMQLLAGLVVVGAARLSALADSLRFLQQERTLPRPATVSIELDGAARTLPGGIFPFDVLPATVDGERVVAALLNHNVVPLDAPIAVDGTLSPITEHFEGERIYRQSLALLLLEAAHHVAPQQMVTLGPSVGVLQWIDLRPAEGVDRQSLGARVQQRMRDMIAADVPFRHELWSVDEASRMFAERGWDSAVRLLAGWRETTVPLVSCGELYALAVGPLVSSAGRLGAFTVTAPNEGLLLDTSGAETPTARPPAAYAALLRDHDRWVRSLGIEGVGSFNESCVKGDVGAIIRVAEGFHERRLVQIADAIAARPGVRVVCIAGPSSSGKTTFIKRLCVQLQVSGIQPVNLSLDDYYVDREKTVRDAKGEYDFEALEALDLVLLAEQLRALLRGDAVPVARYDFKSGRSHASGGKTVQLGPQSLLMLEGIHGLNERLLGDAVESAQVFRIFIQPMFSLGLDRLTRVNPSDLRLLRRIVRDRHTRNINPAENIRRWPSVREGERKHIFPFVGAADAHFDTSLIYEPSVLKTYAERYLLEVPRGHASFPTALRLRQLIDRFVAIYPDHVPPTSLLREFIGTSSFEY